MTAAINEKSEDEFDFVNRKKNVKKSETKISGCEIGHSITIWIMLLVVHSFGGYYKSNESVTKG